MLYMIGIGLGCAQDITLKGLRAIKESDHVFFETYTSITRAKEELEQMTNKKFIDANRDLVESCAEEIINKAKNETVSFLVIGDVFGATTHTDLYLRAKKEKIEIKIINNASILNAAGNTGLELYRFGQTTSIVFDDAGWMPNAPYNVIKQNKERGLHTLCLLDIKTAEPSIDDLKRGINKPQPPRFMTIKKAIEILEKLEEKNQENILDANTLAIGIARIGLEDETIITAPLSKLKEKDFGAPLHSLIIPGKLHEIEEEMINQFK
ncbi:MAG: diphthine synthase [Candidatus Woesearchaeota archaeon]